MQFRHSDKAKDLNHSICSFHRPCEWNKQLPFPRSGWQKCLWFAKNPAVDVHSNPSSTRGAWRYYRFYFDHSWTFLHEQGFLFCVCICQRKDDQSMLSSFFKAYKHHMLPSAVQGAPQKKKKKNHISKWKKGEQVRCGFFFFYHHFPALMYQARATKAINLNFCVVLVLYVPFFHVSHYNTLPSQRGAPGRNWEWAVKAWVWNWSQRTFLWP